MATLLFTIRLVSRSVIAFVYDLVPYIALTSVSMVAMAFVPSVITAPWLLLIVQGVIGLVIYIGTNALLGSRIQRDALAYLLHKQSL